jgi:DNA-directed RNA polymerase beta' subunit
VKTCQNFSEGNDFRRKCLNEPGIVFDGDEMNIHVPQLPDAQAELRLLSSNTSNIMSSQSSKSNIKIVQDALLGSFLLTKGEVLLTRDKFFNVSMKGDWNSKHTMDKIQHIRRVMKKEGKKVKAFTGKGLFSLLLPNDFYYENKNNADENEPTVKIIKGVLLEGVINKKDLGGGHQSIIPILYKEYGSDICCAFVNNLQFIVNDWLVNRGFSVGIKDCISTKKEEIEDVIDKAYIEAKYVEENTIHPVIREAKINAALNKAKDIGMKLAKDALNPDNNFIATVTAGSKGDYFNIAQITGLLGQQNVSGKRIVPELNGGRRTLPHYKFSGLNNEKEFESRGFIRHSFIHGLNPYEFWFHAKAGREGITDTAMKTSSSGYIQRRMVKMAEDIQVKYDGTVRSAYGSVIQFSYGDDGYDGVQTVILDGKPQCVDIDRLVNRLNERVK